MNLNPIDFNYIDGENIYPLQDYVDETINNLITNNIYTSNIYITATKKLNEVIYYNDINLNIHNNISFGEIQFKTSSSYPEDNTKTGTIIDYTGKLKVYHNYNLLQPTFTAGYYDVEAELLQLKADGINTDAQFILLEGNDVYLQDQITSTRNGLIITETQVAILIDAVYSGQTYESFKNITESSTILTFRNNYISTVGGMAIRANQRWQNALINISGVSVILGLAGAVVGAASSYLSYERASNALYSNLNFTTAEKNTIYNEGLSYEIQSYTNYNNSMSNLNILNGFINSGVTTSQTIPKISTTNISVTTDLTGGHIKLYTNNSNGNSSILFNNNVGTQSYIGLGGTGITNYANNLLLITPNSIIFNTGGKNNLMTPSMCITSGGTVGINIQPSAIPAGYKLYVTGNSYFDGSIAATSLITNSIIYNTQQLSTTLNSYLLLSGGTLTGPLTLNTGLYGNPGPYPAGYNGDRIILQTGIGTNGYPYSLGINTDIFWNCAPATASYKWYSGATNTATLDNTGLLTLPSITTTANLNVNGISKLANYSVIGYPYVDYNGFSQTSIFAGPSTAVNLVLESRSSNYGACLLLTNNYGTSSYITVGGSTTTPTLFRNNMILSSTNSIILNGGNHATETPDFIIDSSGNIGIGTTSSSSYKLLTNGGIKSTGLTVDKPDGAYLTLTSSNPAIDTGIYLYNTSAPGVAGYIGIGGTTLANLVSQSNLTITSKNSIVFNNFSSPNASMTILQNGNIGIGTSIAVSKLTILPQVIDRWTYDHSLAPLTITNQTPTNSNVLNDTLDILNLCRQGTSMVCYGARATFRICRYENVIEYARTRLDLVLAHANYITETTVITFLSSGNVGIGKTNPNCKLYISAGLTTSATCYSMRLSSGASTDNGGFGTLLGLGSEPNGWSKCAIGHTRMGAYDVGDIIFLCRTAQDATDCTMSDERMRITSGGNVGIGTNLPRCKLNIYGGAVNFTNNNPYAVPYGKMQAGSLTIGDCSLDYGNAYYTSGSWDGTNTAGLLLECNDKTEIIVHDSGNRLVSLMNYIGGASSNVIQIGRYMGLWTAPTIELRNSTTINGNLTVNGTITGQYNIICSLTTIAGIPNAWHINLNQYNIAGQANSVYFSCSHYNSTGPITIYWVGHILINSFNASAPTISFSTIFNSTNCSPSWFYDGTLWLQILSSFAVTGSILKYKIIG